MVCMEMLMSQGCLVIAHSCKFSIQFFHSKSHCRSSTLFKTSAISYCTFKLNNKIKIERKMLNKYFEAVDNWIPQNDGLVRTTPILLGCSSIIALLLNRTFSGISFIADASSGHSRADLLALALAITMLLTGLIWKSVEPKEPPIVNLQGVECFLLNSTIPMYLESELKWVWEALSTGSKASALVIAYRGMCVLQAGIAAESPDSKGRAVQVDVNAFLKGSLWENVRASGKQIYLANLTLYPGRFELSFLPKNMQAVILQPLGEEGIMVVGSSQVRGFSPRDQAWMVTIGEKIDASFIKWVVSHS